MENSLQLCQHGRRKIVFRISKGHDKDLLSEVCLERGWMRFDEESDPSDGWDIWWRGSAPEASLQREMYPWQIVNHIPRALGICRKDVLARQLRKMRKIYGEVFNFSPTTYILPAEYNQMIRNCGDIHGGENKSSSTPGKGEHSFLICKPVGLSRGRGVHIIRNPKEVSLDTTQTVVQEYISNPFLVRGHKMDLRVYALVSTPQPLVVHLYSEGFARFASERYSLMDLENRFCHLTNSSVNHGNGGSHVPPEDLKWSLSQLRRYFDQINLQDWLLWQRIRALICLTLISQFTSTTKTFNCFELLGFDILIDEHLKPWLLEVNKSPSLIFYSEIDTLVKKPMLHDMFELLGLPKFQGCSPLSDEVRRLQPTVHNGRDTSVDREVVLSRRSERSPLLDDSEDSSSLCSEEDPQQRIPMSQISIAGSKVFGVDLKSVLFSGEEVVGPNSTYLFSLTTPRSSTRKSKTVLPAGQKSWKHKKKDSLRFSCEDCVQRIKSEVKSRSWRKVPQGKVGNWIRILPSSNRLNRDADSVWESVGDIKKFLNVANRVSAAAFSVNKNASDHQLDQQLVKCLGPLFLPWHPRTNFM